MPRAKRKVVEGLTVSVSLKNNYFDSLPASVESRNMTSIIAGVTTLGTSVPWL